MLLSPLQKNGSPPAWPPAGRAGKPGATNVETHPGARRRGLAGTLVWHAAVTALAGETSTLVMVADPDDAAIRGYESVGFTVTEPQLGLVRPPA
jgi:FR47-like protein